MPCFYKATKGKHITGGQVFICLCHSGVFEDGIRLYFIMKYAVAKTLETKNRSLSLFLAGLNEFIIICI